MSNEIKQEIIDKYKPVFMEDLKEYDDPNKEKKVEENVGEPMNTEKVVEKLIKDEDLSDHTKKRMKKMFRDVMKKTHPDKEIFKATSPANFEREPLASTGIK